MKTYWIKLYVESVEDPKLAKLPDNLWRRFVECLMMAGRIGEDGFLPALADMAFTLRKQETALQHELEQLAKVGLMEIKPYDLFQSRWYVSKFSERQAPSAAATRQKRHRDKKKESTPQSPLKEKREEKEVTDPYTYCYSDSNVTRNVTNNVTRNASEEEERMQDAYDRSLVLIEKWQKLTVNRRRLNVKDKDDYADYFVPAISLVDLFDNDDAAAWQAVEGEYYRMIREGLTVKRLSAVSPGVAAAVNRLSVAAAQTSDYYDPAMPEPGQGGVY